MKNLLRRTSMKKLLTPVMVVCLALTTTGLGANLIVNGDFEAGNTGFTSDYTYVAPPLSNSGTNSLGAPAVYSVETDPYKGHAGWASYGDHTSGAGNMLIGNAACDDEQPTPGVETIWA